MNTTEALQICRLAKAASPAQAVDDFTPDLWAMVLEKVRFEDAREAVVALAAEQEWIHVSHIVKRVKRIRLSRVDHYLDWPDPPAEVAAGDGRDYLEWHADITRRIADGEEVGHSNPRVSIEGQARVAALMAAKPIRGMDEESTHTHAAVTAEEE